MKQKNFTKATRSEYIPDERWLEDARIKEIENEIDSEIPHPEDNHLSTATEMALGIFLGIFGKEKLGISGQIYAFSNEDIENLFKNLNLKNKKVMTVGSSGDQVLWSIYNGAKDIDVYDSCIWTRHYIEYKIAAIKNLSYEEFSDAFTIPNILSPKYYAKFSHDIVSPSVRQFWDTIMLELDSKDRANFTFDNFHYPSNWSAWNKSRNNHIFYKNEANYNELKKKLMKNKFEINYFIEDYLNFSSTVKKDYDLILLSNIYQYIKSEDTFFEIFDSLLKHFKPNGAIQANYKFYLGPDFAHGQIIDRYPFLESISYDCS